MFEHNLTLEKALRFSRFDPEHLFSTVSPHSFVLEDKSWASVEHYYQAHKFSDAAYAEHICAAPTPREAYRLGNRWFKPKRRGWQKMRRVIMTRGLYCKCTQHREVQNALLDTGDRLLVETSLYDHFWGIGRDQRGVNMLGKILMDIRAKLRQSA